MTRSTPPAGRRSHLAAWPALLLTTLVAACQAQPLAGDARAANAALLQRIQAEVGQASCTSTADCRTLPIGSKACGGPAQWMAWSATASRGDKLQAWAEELADRQRQADLADGRMSTCSVVPDPGATCDSGRCVLLKANLIR
jgi:hypothetical protein